MCLQVVDHTTLALQMFAVMIKHFACILKIYAAHSRDFNRELAAYFLFDRKFLEFPIKQKLRDGSHLAERKIMLRIPLGRERVRSTLCSKKQNEYSKKYCFDGIRMV